MSDGDKIAAAILASVAALQRASETDPLVKLYENFLAALEAPEVLTTPGASGSQ